MLDLLTLLSAAGLQQAPIDRSIARLRSITRGRPRCRRRETLRRRKEDELINMPKGVALGGLEHAGVW